MTLSINTGMARMTRNPLDLDDRAGWIRLGAVPIVLLATVGHPSHAPHGTPAAAKAEPPAGPQLSISITDGQHTARPGERLSYLIQVQDTGPASLPRLAVTQTLTSGTRLVSASHGGVASASLITWHVRLAGHSTATFRSVLRLLRPPTGTQRLAAVACAATQHGKPLVCAAHLDTLPAAALAGQAGARRAAGQSRQTGGRGGGTPVGGTVSVLAALAVAAVAAAGGWRLWRHRRLRQAD